MAIIDNLKNKNGDLIYPRTLTSAVYDSEGKLLKSILNDMNNKIETSVPIENELKYLNREMYKWEKRELLVEEIFNDNVISEMEEYSGLIFSATEGNIPYDTGDEFTIKLYNNNLLLDERTVVVAFSEMFDDVAYIDEVEEPEYVFMNNAPFAEPNTWTIVYREEFDKVIIEEKSLGEVEILYSEDIDEYPIDGWLGDYHYKQILLTQSDWNESDSNNSAYIQNRTHHYQEILTAQGLISHSNLSGPASARYRWFEANGVVAGLVEGEQYKYTINERTYNNIAYKIEGSPHIYLGDPISEVSSASSDDKHQLRTNAYDSTPGISIYLPGATETRAVNFTVHRFVLKKLDSKFLPDEIITEISSLLPISGGTLETYTEKLQSTTGAIDLSLANVFTDTPTANRTYSITNTKTGVSHSFTLYIAMGATVRTLTFPANVNWAGGEIPDMTTANKTYVLVFSTIDGGRTWFGMFGGEFYRFFIPEGYVLATDDDFSGETNGSFRYIGTALKVVIPREIKGMAITSYSNMFDSDAGKLVEGVVSYNKNITNMNSMFYNSQATTLDLSNFDTSNVTDMSFMFRNSQATSLDLSSFNTSKVTNMSNMFQNSQATTLDLSSFDTSIVTNMGSMFRNTQAISLDLSSFDTSIVTNMNYMFTSSQATTGYARLQADADRFNASSGKPSGLNFVVKP